MTSRRLLQPHKFASLRRYICSVRHAEFCLRRILPARQALLRLVSSQSDDAAKNATGVCWCASRSAASATHRGCVAHRSARRSALLRRLCVCACVRARARACCVCVCARARMCRCCCRNAPAVTRYSHFALDERNRELMVASGCVDELLPPAHAGSIFALLAERAPDCRRRRRSAAQRAGGRAVYSWGRHACMHIACPAGSARHAAAATQGFMPDPS